MKKFKVYQLPVENNAKFMRLEFVKKHGIMPKLSDYKLVGESVIYPKSGTSVMTMLEDIFTTLNTCKCDWFSGHSLSMSDVVEIDGRYYYCDDFGWKEVSFPTDDTKKKYIVTADGVSFVASYDTREEAQAKADELNDDYYQHKVWNVEEVADENDTTSLTTKNATTMEKKEKKVVLTTDEKVFNLCVESAKQSGNGFTFDLKGVWTAARLKYKMAKQTVLDAMESVAKEHEIKKCDEEGKFILVELMPKPKAEPVKEKPAKEKKGTYPCTPCEIAQFNARKLARKVFGEKFTNFAYSRYDATNKKEYGNASEAKRDKADMDNLLYVVIVVDGVEYMAETRIEAYQKFLDEFNEKVA